MGEQALAATAAGAPRAIPAEPRKEIMFRRRVGLVTAARELWAFRELTFTLAERDLRVRYKQAFLGVAWAVITPVIMMLAFTLLINKVTHTHTGPRNPPYALWSYMGLLPWSFFSGALSAGGMSLVSNTPLLNKLYCPREVFPIAAIVDSAFDALIATLVLAIMFPALGFAPAAQIYYVPLLLLLLFMVTLGVTLAVAAIVVYMRDLRLVLPVVIQFGLFVTPVIFPATKLSHSEPVLIGYSVLNPLVPVIDGLRRCVLSGQAPHWSWLAAGTASSLVCLVGGFWLFKRLETGMADIA